MRILLIDDDSDDAYMIRRELERYEVSVDWVPDFKAGIARFDSGGYDAVLVDQFLGVRTGLEFLAHARRSAPDVPVILITGVDSTEIDEAALEAGAAGYVVKSDARGDLLDRTLRYAVRHTSAGPQTSGDDGRPRPAGKDLTLQVALSRGMTIRDAARTAGMSERTAYRRMNDPVFQAQLAQIETELRERMMNRAVDDLLGGE